MSGQAHLFQDSRIELIENSIKGGFENKDILELGPLEAGHTMMMSQKAKKVTAIEANSRAYVKCLIVKEVLKIDNAEFLLGDFDKYLKDCKNFDFVLACGVIYHCKNPVETLVKISEKSNSIGIWSHYFQEDYVRPKYGDKFTYTPEIVEYNGCKANCYKHSYANALDIPGFCGGGNETTYWMDRDSWFELFDHLGFDFKVLSESLDHINGPAFTAVAVKR